MKMRRWLRSLMMLMALSALILLPGAVKAATSDDYSFTSNYKNQVSSAHAELTGDTIELKVSLNGAYGGAGTLSERVWTVYALVPVGDDVKVVKEELTEEEYKSVSGYYTMKYAFPDGAAIYLGSYTNFTSANRNYWTDVDDILELMENGHTLVLPEKPADPKVNAKKVTVGKKVKTVSDSFVIGGGTSDKHFIKITTKKPAWMKITRLSWAKEYEYSNPVLRIFEDGEEDKDDNYSFRRIYQKGDTYYLPKGTYWLRAWAYEDNTVQLAFQIRYHRPATKVIWTVDGKEVKEGSAIGVDAGQKLPVTGKIYPSNSDSAFYDEKSIDGKYLEDIVLSKDKKSFTCTFESAPDYLGTMAETITATVANVTYDSQATNTGSLKSAIAIGTPPDKPDFGKYDYLTVYQTTATFQNKRIFASNVYMEISLKKGRKWIKRIDEPILGEYTVSGLTANKKYTFRARNYLKVNGVKIYSDPQVMTVKTGVTKTPEIKSLKVSGIKKHSRKVDGYWDDKGKWHKGYTLYSKTYTLKAALKKKVASGALGLRVVGGEQKKGKGTSFTFKCSTGESSAGYPTSANLSFSFWSDKKFGGYSPSSKVYKVSLK